jgi:diguanylate cyclase (GGDEF)-like protein
VGAAVTSSLVLEDVLATVARRIAEALGVWECDLYEYYSESQTIVASATWSREMTQDDIAWPGTAVALKDRESYRAVFIDGGSSEAYADDEALDPADRELMVKWGELASFSLALVFEGSVIGCLTLVEKRSTRHFSDDDKHLASLLAIPAATAIHNARLYRQQEEQNRHLDALLDSSRALTSTVVLEDVLALVCRKAAEALTTGQCVIYEHDPGQDAIVYRAAWEADPAQASTSEFGTVFPLDDYPSDRKLLRDGLVVVESLSDEALPADVRASMEEWGEKTCLNVPLTFHDEPMGLLVLADGARERHYSAAEMELARGLGEQAAVAIRHSRLYGHQERQNQRLLALLETSRVLAASLDAAAVCAEMRKEIAALFRVLEADVNVCLRSADGRYYALEDALAVDAEAEPGGDDDGPVAVDLDELTSLAGNDHGAVQSRDGDRARLVVPLVLSAEAEGFVEVGAGGDREFSKDDIGLLQILASQAAAAIINVRLYQTIERQAITDGLTGLYNHRYFYERLNQEFARAERYGLPLSLLMLDIDDFKRFNDSYGHPVGDLVLGEVGTVLAEQLRRHVDFAARYGGEEFAILLPNTSSDGAQVVGDRLVREVAALGQADADAPAPQVDGARCVGERIRARIAAAELPGVAAGDDVHVTVSVGLASLPGTASSPDKLVRNADKALYLAKRLGKNRVEVFADGLQ